MSDEKLQDMPDEMLMERFKATRENGCFAEIFARHRKEIFHRCLAVVHQPSVAEDLTQETFKTAFVKIGLFCNGNAHAWLCSIARHLAVNHARSAIVSHELSGIDSCPEVGSVDKANFNLPALEEVRAILKQLPAPQRICLKLFYIQGYSYKEVSQITGYSEGAVKSHIQNGRRQFARIRENLNQKNGQGQR
jgi:RNA polymerase sigma factor (sigma-70 family)